MPHLIGAPAGVSRALAALASAACLYLAACPAIAGAPAPDPADRATVLAPLSSLDWTLDPAATAYDVYAGSDSTAVAEAGTGDAAYAGTVAGGPLAPPEEPALGATLYWRVDAVTAEGVERGPVWSCTVFPLSVQPRCVRVAAATCMDAAKAVVSVGAAGAPGVVAWAAATDTPWLALSCSDGSAPCPLGLEFTLAGLAPGLHAGVVTLSAGGLAAELPVELTVFTLDVAQMLPDYDRGFLYALHPGAGQGDDAFLVRYDMEEERALDALPIGRGPTDMALASGRARLYVTNWPGGPLRIVDLDAMVQLPPLDLGPDVHRVNTLGQDRLVVEGTDGWVEARIVDAGTGAVLGASTVREGDGEGDPTGRWYYHGDYGVLTSALHKYDTADGVLTEIIEGYNHPYGARTVIRSGDGARLFWMGYVCSSDLFELNYVPTTVQCVSWDGRWLVGDRAVWNADTSVPVLQLPFTPRASAPSRTFDRIFAFDPGSGLIEALPTGMVSAAPAAPPATFALASAAPNPFNPQTALGYTVTVAGPVRIRVFDLRGRLVATLVDRTVTPGRHRAAWRGHDDAGRPAGAGVYVVRLESAEGVRTRRVTLLK